MWVEWSVPLCWEVLLTACWGCLTCVLPVPAPREHGSDPSSREMWLGCNSWVLEFLFNIGVTCVLLTDLYSFPGYQLLRFGDRLWEGSFLLFVASHCLKPSQVPPSGCLWALLYQLGSASSSFCSWKHLISPLSSSSIVVVEEQWWMLLLLCAGNSSGDQKENKRTAPGKQLFGMAWMFSRITQQREM